MMIKYGKNIVVILLGKYAYKFPLGKRGKLANEIEYQNAENNSNVVRTEKHRCFLKQERIKTLRCFSLDVNPECVPIEPMSLFRQSLHNKLQVGQNEIRNWKFYDNEDVKYYFELQK